MYSAMMMRACRSPVMSIRSVHSARAVRTNLSAMAFMRGACGAVVTASIPQAVKTASNAAVNLESRSRIRCVSPCPAPVCCRTVSAGDSRGAEAGAPGATIPFVAIPFAEKMKAAA